MQQYRRFQKKVNRRKRRKRLFLFILLPILIVGLSATAYGSYLFAKAKSVVSSSFEEVENRNASPMRDRKIDPKKDNISVLFMGIDDNDNRNYGDSARTDALLLATLNEKDKSVKVVSIPRDSYVYIPERDRESKINHAHAYGGTKATIETVEHLFDVPVDYYVKLNFKAFIDIVDALGGIEFDVPYNMKEKDSKDKHNGIVLEKGVQTLDGEEALAVARTRKYDNDVERGKRQQQIIQAMVKEASSIGSVTKYGNLIEAVGDNMKTNLTFGEMLSFYDYGTQGTSIDVQTLNLEGEDSRQDGVYYYELDDESVDTITETLREHLELKNNEHPSELEEQ
ncbi:LCP family protein [Metabacillus iocasae]|uniref:LCP family protein required for cell wall assembly n=1 Tax=Priestia iocasae TaxID=2291674 RepID=A0ABS2QZS2_9BACI|nr:LCP family protein [Metabacillus iocasae]MBM7703969.1 LCP family protein required for cell wall assembly [Metabacillus iocasae]